MSDAASSASASPSPWPDVRPGGGLVAVHAHPDDETLSTGALLATWAAAGLPATVVTCTRGERGEVLALPGTTSEGLAHLGGDGPRLGAYRETELARAVAALGVDQVFLDALPENNTGQATAPGFRRDVVLAGSPVRRYEDSGMRWVRPGVAGPAPDAPARAFSLLPLEEPAARLAGLLRRLRPSVVVTYEPGGGYGHPDHVRTHQVAVRAIELAADADAVVPGDPWAGAGLWQVVAPAHEVRAARRALAADPAARAVAEVAGLAFADPGEPLPPFAKERLDGRVVRCAVGPMLDRVLAALRAHATQVQGAGAAGPDLRQRGVAGWYALGHDVLAPVPAHETYLVG
ncbi:PIG-L family deacetylase [Antribacter gilvus]|uniref:PIG-L family deacetylase n=1 Tax=Antribacter gilvus TaxID=2304675 RepID=UPI00197F44F4|nr:PIG-L family deacetylase [Antribacter gilvus]